MDETDLDEKTAKELFCKCLKISKELINKDLSGPGLIDEISNKFGLNPEEKEFLKNCPFDPALSLEECLRKGCRLSKEFHRQKNLKLVLIFS